MSEEQETAARFLWAAGQPRAAVPTWNLHGYLLESRRPHAFAAVRRQLCAVWVSREKWAEVAGNAGSVTVSDLTCSPAARPAGLPFRLPALID